MSRTQHTHYPQYAGEGAAGKTSRGPFGDSLLEFDNTVGNLLATLQESGVINNTLVFFTADNGSGIHTRALTHTHVFKIVTKTVIVCNFSLNFVVSGLR